MDSGLPRPLWSRLLQLPCTGTPNSSLDIDKSSSPKQLPVRHPGQTSSGPLWYGIWRHRASILKDIHLKECGPMSPLTRPLHPSRMWYCRAITAWGQNVITETKFSLKKPTNSLATWNNTVCDLSFNGTTLEDYGLFLYFYCCNLTVNELHCCTSPSQRDSHAANDKE